eukprot:5427364-Pyramimonas_sp.AAC.1
MMAASRSPPCQDTARKGLPELQARAPAAAVQHETWKGIPPSRFSQAWLSPQFPTYTSDARPQHWNQKRSIDAEKYYLSMPEEFYIGTSFPVITPILALQWMPQVSQSAQNALGHHQVADGIALQEVALTSERDGHRLWARQMSKTCCRSFPSNHRELQNRCRVETVTYQAETSRGNLANALESS